MATTFTWSVTQMDCYPEYDGKQDFVFVCHWTCNGTDGTYNASVYSTCSLPVVQGTTFIPYQDLTLETVLGWIWANGVDKDSAEAAVAQQIQNQITPPITTPVLPWASPTV